ncbi:PREDICTED: probable polygalacturonase At1g80170 [Nelumbo nucifera]|uniref:endo-polygalacturonase n=1 Tax=Nelumbo nucifera TaxID=4432 RepID=A0A1U7Z9B4_NELNU|nr:PREDICTED: probable polygalacturonase At1g80170 [Nelumbo nucifera]
MRKWGAKFSCNLMFIIVNVFLCLNLICAKGFEPLIQLPRFRSRNRLRFRRVVSVKDFGAKGDGLTDDSQAFTDAWTFACSLPYRPRLEVPAGRTYLVGPTDFSGPCRSSLTLRVSGNITAPKNPASWKGFSRRRWLYFYRLNRFTVEGGGTINGMGKEWWARSCKINATYPCRHAPTAITFRRCKNLKVQHLIIVNSQQMHMAFSKSHWVMASYLQVIAPRESPNTDGIHISASTHVVIKYSVIKTGDDCVSIVSNSSMIQVRNIYCGPGHGISIGSLGKSNSLDSVSHVLVDGAIISNTENGLRIKTWQGGHGFAKDITFQSVQMENVSNPIIIDQYYCDSPLPCPNQTSAVQVVNVSYVGIKGTSATGEAIRFACSDTFPCKKIYLENIHLRSYLGELTRTFCWKARGSSYGSVCPPPCSSWNRNFIEQLVYSSTTNHLQVEEEPLPI